ncbi:alpha/beta fold hydrolase [Tenggerimyces flavus]|uniref:Alpha/beta fold hydrolase n=1 Tax=Tenggerimyces flavus TaxID=1708749 RepID=A0ABV7YJ85_9ACTN|nr:alpha/beta hydrolase [Tenggerimyces flavus]MBM7787571.1 pimeloyl-ACP methyl ester carboxylesterase [Tenggerimyces flavus]
MNDSIRTGTIPVAGGTQYYEVRGSGPLLALVAAPMDAAAFAPLADDLAADFTVLTIDPRGIGRSPLDDPSQDSTPEDRADDMVALVAHLDLGPATVFGSSGGAVTTLALAARHPSAVHTVIAHEPPLNELLPDRETLHEKTEEMIALYGSGDPVGAWRLFMKVGNLNLPDEIFEMIFGGERDAARAEEERRFFLHELRATTHFAPDLGALRSGPARLVIGIGEESTDQQCDRTSRALGAELGIEPTLFPGDHTGFVDNPAPFAKKLREVLRQP